MTTRASFMRAVVFLWVLAGFLPFNLHGRPQIRSGSTVSDTSEGGTPETGRRHARLPPIPTSPVEQFLALFSASAEERNRMLTEKSPESRALILKRLQEFEALSPIQREQQLVQLRLAQFRYYLSSLLRVPVSDRTVIMEGVPEADRELLLERLKVWDRLSRDVQEEILESDRRFHYFVRQSSANSTRLDEVLAVVPTRAKPHVERQFQQWASLRPDERMRRSARFQRFFDLTPREREEGWGLLSDRDRRLMEISLAQYAKLPEEKKQKVLLGFSKFAELSQTDQEAFLANAARWQAMTPEERTIWRRLVQDLPTTPPLPPIGPSTNRLGSSGLGNND